MMRKRYSAALASAIATPVFAAVNLEWRKPIQSVCVGDTVRVELLAVASGASEELVAGVDLVFAWDPAYLDLLGRDQTGAAMSQFAGFPSADLFGLNEAVPPQDGDGLFVVLAQFGNPIVATPAGARLTTLVFQAVAESPGATLIEMLPSGGTPTIATTVWSGSQANTPITGSLSNAQVGVVFQICPGDIDDDQIVDLNDLTLLLSAFGLSNGGDLNCDGVTDLIDLALLLSQYGTSCL